MIDPQHVILFCDDKHGRIVEQIEKTTAEINALSWWRKVMTWDELPMNLQLIKFEQELSHIKSLRSKALYFNKTNQSMPHSDMRLDFYVFCTNNNIPY